MNDDGTAPRADLEINDPDPSIPAGCLALGETMQPSALGLCKLMNIRMPTGPGQAKTTISVLWACRVTRTYIGYMHAVQVQVQANIA